MRTSSILVPVVLVLLVGTTVAEARPGAARARAEAAVKSLAHGRDITVRWRPDGTRPSVIRGLSEATMGRSVQERALGFIGAHPDLFLPTSQLRAVQTRSAGGLTVVRLKQVTSKDGVEVDGGELTVALDSAGKVTSVHAELIPLSGPVPRAKLDREAAVGHVLGRLAGKKGPAAVPAELRGLRPALMVLPCATPRLVYRVMVPLWLDPLGRIHLVDAVNGELLGWRPGMKIDGHKLGKGVSR